MEFLRWATEGSSDRPWGWSVLGVVAAAGLAFFARPRRDGK